MEIKEEVIETLKGFFGNYTSINFSEEWLSKYADKLVAIFEAKIKAVDKEFMDSLEGMPSDYPSLVLKVAKLRANLSQLTATKLEGEK